MLMRLEIDLKRSTVGLSHKGRRGCWKKNVITIPDICSFWLAIASLNRERLANECKSLRQNSQNCLWKDGVVSIPPYNNVINSSSEIEITFVSCYTIFCQTG